MSTKEDIERLQAIADALNAANHADNRVWPAGGGLGQFNGTDAYLEYDDRGYYIVVGPGSCDNVVSAWMDPSHAPAVKKTLEDAGQLGMLNFGESSPGGPEQPRPANKREAAQAIADAYNVADELDMDLATDKTRFNRSRLVIWFDGSSYVVKGTDE